MAAAKKSRHRTEPHPGALVVGKRIRALRLEASITFDAFVEETGLGRGYISELERGLVVPTLDALERIARVLDVPVRELLPDDREG